MAGGEDWRDAMDLARGVARKLAEEGWLQIVQDGEPIDEPEDGPIRLRQSG